MSDKKQNPTFEKVKNAVRNTKHSQCFVNNPKMRGGTPYGTYRTRIFTGVNKHDYVFYIRICKRALDCLQVI